MEFRPHQAADSSAIVALVCAAFAGSEGEAEGALVGHLAEQLLTTTAPRDLYVFVATDGAQIRGAIFFSRLSFEEEKEREVFILGPVAIHTEHQGEGIGQALIAYGLDELARDGVEIALTYGDPAYYGRVGFEPLSQERIQPPLELSQPRGWLGQSLTDGPIEKIEGGCSCVEAFDDPAYW